MKPEDAGSALERATERVAKAAEALDVTPLQQAANEVAIQVRKMAAAQRDSVGIRVVAKGDGVRITVVGPKAARYRAIVDRELEARVPQASAEIRAQITRRAR